VWLMVPELNGSEGARPSGRGEALGSSEVLGPTYTERGGVRRLSTDSVAGTEARGGGGNLPEADRRLRAWTTRNGVASSYRCAQGVRRTRWLQHGMQHTTMLRQCEHARVIAERSEAAIGRSWRGGDVKGIFCPYVGGKEVS
jgi:hypothetical protein